MAQTLEPEALLRPAGEYVERLRRGPDVAVAILANVVQTLLGALRKGVRDMIAEGIERRWAAFFLKEFLDLLDRAAAAADEVERRGPSSDAVARLAEYRRRVAAIRKDAAALLDWVERPLPPIDPAKLPPPAGKDAPGFVPLDALLGDARPGN